MEAKNSTILITSGATVEPIDPVRYISNFSTGTMGYNLAVEAVKMGFKVIFVSGPTALPEPEGVKTIKILTAGDMRKAVMANVKKTDCVIMAAAVCDFRPKKLSRKKIKKENTVTLNLTKNQDIIKNIEKGGSFLKVGFALETEKLADNAKKKMIDKGLDLIVANKKDKKNDPFGGGKKEFLLIDKSGKTIKTGKITKRAFAGALLNEIAKRIK